MFMMMCAFMCASVHPCVSMHVCTCVRVCVCVWPWCVVMLQLMELEHIHSDVFGFGRGQVSKPNKREIQPHFLDARTKIINLDVLWVRIQKTFTPKTIRHLRPPWKVCRKSSNSLAPPTTNHFWMCCREFFYAGGRVTCKTSRRCGGTRGRDSNHVWA